MLRHYDQHGGGVKVYTHNLLREFASIETEHEFVFIYRNSARVGTYSNGNRVRELAIEIPRLFPGDRLIRKRLDDFLWDQFAMPTVEKRERLDIIFNPKYSLPLRAKCRTVFVDGSYRLIPPWKVTIQINPLPSSNMDTI